MNDGVITLECPVCHLRMPTALQEHDYPEAVRMVLKCPDCWDGDFDEPIYFDAAGKVVEYDPDEIPDHRARSATQEGR